MRFTGKRVLITGASSGIGEALARQLASQRVRLTLAARRANLLSTLADACRSAGSEALVVPTDVADPSQCEALIRRAVEAFGGLDVLVLNAGITMEACFEDVQDVSMYSRLMQVNYLSAVYLAHEALPHLKQSRGQFVVVSSLTGKVGIPTRSGYSASKHALHGFFDALRAELLGTGVSVTVVCPGFVQTEIRRHALSASGTPEGGYEPAGAQSMTADACAKVILKAAAARKREVVMTFPGKLAEWLKLIAPWLLDRAVRRQMRPHGALRTGAGD
jgi:short-subunit dehydrogenase